MYEYFLEECQQRHTVLLSFVVHADRSIVSRYERRVCIWWPGLHPLGVCQAAGPYSISPYFLDRNLRHLVSVIRLADASNYGPNYGEEEEGQET